MQAHTTDEEAKARIDKASKALVENGAALERLDVLSVPVFSMVEIEAMASSERGSIKTAPAKVLTEDERVEIEMCEIVRERCGIALASYTPREFLVELEKQIAKKPAILADDDVSGLYDLLKENYAPKAVVMATKIEDNKATSSVPVQYAQKLAPKQPPQKSSGHTSTVVAKKDDDCCRIC